MPREFPSPASQGRFADVKPRPLLAHRPDDHMHVRMRLVRMQHHRVAVVEREFLTREVLYCLEHLLWRRSRGHREHQFVYALGRVPTPPIEIRTLPMLMKVEVPVLGKVLRHARAREPLAVVGLDSKLSLIPVSQVIEVPAYGPEILAAPAQDLDHNFRCPPRGSGDLIDLSRRQSVSPSRPPASVRGDVEQRLAAEANGPSRHIPDSSPSHWPQVAPSR